MSERLTPWLLPAPADFRTRLRAVGAGSASDLCRLAQHELDQSQATRLSAAARQHAADLKADGSLAAVRIGLISSHTTDYIVDALPAVGLRHRILVSCVRGEYGQLAQSVLDPMSPLAGAVDYVVLAVDAAALGLAGAALADGAARRAVDAALDTVKGLRDGVRERLGATCVLQTLPPPADPLFGEFDRRVPGSPTALIEDFNQRLVSEVLGSADILVDVARLAQTIGLARWHDPRDWHNAKLPFALDLTPLYCDLIARVVGAAVGKARKCLVLDLDNTVWGGVIGDDGVEGIKLGQGDAVGEAHVALQKYALALRERGVILAVCSKNDHAVALQPFQSHPDMVLKESHIAAFVANWNDKAGNLRDIAASLNIGVDALVFLDDNPAEREIVRRELPEVAVPEVGSDAADYVAAVARGGWFESLAFSQEDRNRADFYQANSARLQAQASITDMEEYLKSLDMTAHLAPFDGVGRARIAQLINKSNQFNLTTRRYTEADVAAFEADPDKFTLQVRLTDRFGDNGMISVVIFDKAPDVWSCDTWLMSCRVLGRRVEEAVLDHVATAAKSAGAVRLRGTYVPTKKNGLVERHFHKLGFELRETLEGGSTVWELDLSGYSSPNLPMTLL